LPAHSSPTVKRRRLASELRRYREVASLTIEEVATRLEWSMAKISRIENARVSVLPRDVKFLLREYGLSEQDEAWELLLTLARESRTKGWWQQYGDAIPDWFQVYVGLEAEAATVHKYDSEFVPGLLQTEDYARAIHRAYLVGEPDEEIERRVQVRMARQDLLTSDGQPEVWSVLNEAVIRRVVAGKEAMKRQLLRLVEATAMVNVTLQVIPFAAGAHSSMGGPFSMLSFPEPGDPDIVYIEYQTGALYLEKHDEVRRYRLAFDHLRAAALSIEDSRALIAAAADELA
jgi:hypothetical protein